MARPRVTITEESIPGAISNVATGRVAYVVWSEKGKTFDYLEIESEDDLSNTIGNPDPTDSNNIDNISLDYHICKDFLNYGNDLVIVRAVDPDTAQCARIGIVGSSIGQTGYVGDRINDTGDDVYFTETDEHTIKSGNDLEFYAKDPSSFGNTISVAVSKYTGTDWPSNTDTIDGSTLFSDRFEFGPDDSNYEIALAVLVNGVIQERWIVSLKPGAKNAQGENIYITDFLDANSDYIWGFTFGVSSFGNISSFEEISLQDGTKGSYPSDGDFEDAYEKFLSKNDVQFDYIMDGSHSNNRSYIIDTIAEGRKDCIAFVNCKKSNLLASNVPLSNNDTIVTNIVTDRQTLTNSSWASYQGNWKQVYDKFQDKNIWIPVVSSIVGNKVVINTEQEQWIPAAGTLNGVIRNTIKLAFNPTETQQNKLYKNGINHVYFKPGRGFIVDGQKTMINENIGVSRVNIRDLFRIIEIQVADIAVDFLHQFNDTITRARFTALVEPFLENIQGRGGIVRFQVVANETNNTSAVINSFGFRADVKIEGKRPIEDLLIKFFDVPSGVSFEEVA